MFALDARVAARCSLSSLSIVSRDLLVLALISSGSKEA